ncbi:MAG: hypothetical protein ACR2RE_23775, partial [Geminicoccaceae bacterium]
EPDISYKLDRHGKIDPRKRWLPEMELPLQAQTLEVLTADARRLRFPDSGSWFTAHAELTDAYLARVDMTDLVAGDDAGAPVRIDQDGADGLVQGWLSHLHRQYDFFGQYDKIDAEAFKYGVGVGRMNAVRKSVFIQDAKGVMKENQTLPIIVPRSIKNTYLDDSETEAMNEGMVLGQAVIHESSRRFVDMKLAAMKGSTDPKDTMGGWMPANLANVTPDDNGLVQILEFEGDLVVPRKSTRSMVLPGSIVTVAVWKAGKGSKQTSVGTVIRYRVRKFPFTSYIIHPYHHEDVDDPYAASPLMKGRPIQLAASHALNLLMASGELRTFPPVSWDQNDPNLAGQGGPVIEPNALWETGGISKVTVESSIGEPEVLLRVYIQLVNQYFDVTSVNQPRLGAQTVSHTTAFSKEAELSRGTIRTVDYVRASTKGPMVSFLDKEYRMSLEMMGNTTHSVYMDGFGGFARIKRSFLPDNVTFEAFGAGGPSEEQQKQNRRMAALEMAMRIDQLKINLRIGQPLDYERIQRQVLEDGGWPDVEPFISGEGASGADQGPSTVTGVAPGDPGAAAALLQPVRR